MSSALLVIDVQESFRQRPLWKVISNPDIASTISPLVEASRQAGELVVWIIHTQPGDGSVFDPASGHCVVIDGLQPAEGEPVITKTVHNAFTGTSLEAVLREKGVTEVAICGIRTEQCCETTARIASDLGFGVSFVLDATATNPIAHWDAPGSITIAELIADQRTLSAESIMERTAYALAGRFATITSAREYISTRSVMSSH